AQHGRLAADVLRENVRLIGDPDAEQLRALSELDRENLVLIAIEHRMIRANDLRLNERFLRVDACRRLGIDRPGEAEFDRVAHRLKRGDERAAGVEELLDGLDAGLPEAAADVRRLTVHAEELVFRIL